MTIDHQRNLLRQLSRLWELSPDVRMGQLMAHLGFLGECHHGRGLGEMDDDDMMTILALHESELRARITSITPSLASTTGVNELVTTG